MALGVPFWRAITHDASKFTPSEWGPYVRRFFSGRGGVEDKDADSTEFKAAWFHHWTRNPHHWDFWLFTDEETGAKVAVEMPETYVREMVADWYGAGMAMRKRDIYGWYLAGRKHRYMHEKTLILVAQVIEEAQRKGLFN